MSGASRRDWSRFTPAKRIPVDDGLELRSRRGRHRRELVVPALPLCGRVHPDRGPPDPWPHLRPPGTGDRPGDRGRPGRGPGPGHAAHTVRGPDLHAGGERRAMGRHRRVRWPARPGTPPACWPESCRTKLRTSSPEAGVALFPERGSHLITSCTCPDWATPCKHAAAVCYLMAEAFDDDPFLLLAFRGREREALLAELRARRGRRSKVAAARGPTALALLRARRRLFDLRLADTLATFWQRRRRTWPRCTACLGPPRCPGRCCVCSPGACSWCVVERSPTSWTPPTPGWPPKARPVPSPARRRPHEASGLRLPVPSKMRRSAYIVVQREPTAPRLTHPRSSR